MNKTIPFLLPVRSLLFIAVFVIGAAVTGQAFADITNWWTIVATAVNFLTIGILVLVARKDGKTYKELINYEKGKTKIKDVVITVIVVYLVGMGVMYLTATEIHDNDGNPVDEAPQGQRIAIPVTGKVRPSDKLFKLTSEV